MGHTIDRTYDQNWKHNFIKQVATHVVGIDILKDEINQLRVRGYEVHHIDATSDVNIGEKFERIIIGDVIEHVNNPISLLRFAARHLELGGRILCSTPNPFFVGYIINSLRDSLFIANADHISWITPTMALEIAHRAGIRLHSYWHIQGKGYTVLRTSIHWTTR